MNYSTYNDFLETALITDSKINPNAFVLDWLSNQNKIIKSSIYQIPLNKMRKWYVDEETGSIYHESGKFFSIVGINISTNWGNVPEWEQPIINQPEIGFLGIITKKIDGVLYFLLQAKIEPGNLNIVQLSPTLQATRSNYTKVHKGKAPLFLEYFNGTKNVKILLDQLQSEQGARFLRKRNRNIIIQIDENELSECPDNYLWLTLGQIKKIMLNDNVVNMDTRSVISAIPLMLNDDFSLKEISTKNDIHENYLNALLSGANPYNTFDRILSWFTALKFQYTYNVIEIPLKNAHNWNHSMDSIVHKSGKYFEVIGVHSEIGNREIISWDQPMIKPLQQGLMAFIVKKINGVYHFLVQAKLEPGNMDILEMAPTVQCITGNYRKGENEYDVPFVNEILNAPQKNIWFSTCQSEEGGRFFQEQNRNMVVEVGAEFPIEVPENFCWITLPQLLTFIKFNNYLNISARSLISALSIKSKSNEQ